MSPSLASVSPPTVTSSGAQDVDALRKAEQDGKGFG
jgi:hypothetical protein